MNLIAAVDWRIFRCEYNGIIQAPNADKFSARIRILIASYHLDIGPTYR